jgi:cytochrome c oxidase cbb3-type subunit 4
MTYETVLNFSQTWGVIYFMTIFGGVLIYALRPSARKKFDKAARLPLEED